MSPSALRLSRLHHAARYSALPFLYPCTSISTPPVRRAMMSAWHSAEELRPAMDSPPLVIPTPPAPSVHQKVLPLPRASSSEKPRPKIKAKKAAISITPEAVKRLCSLLNGPTPQLIRIGVRNKGCAGLSYHLEYVDKPEKFDEIVEQDGARVLIDSKALFSVIGSEMDWKEDKLSAKFAFKNPNIVDACGCGESFTVS